MNRSGHVVHHNPSTLMLDSWCVVCVLKWCVKHGHTSLLSSCLPKGNFFKSLEMILQFDGAGRQSKQHVPNYKYISIYRQLHRLRPIQFNSIQFFSIYIVFIMIQIILRHFSELQTMTPSNIIKYSEKKQWQRKTPL